MYVFHFLWHCLFKKFSCKPECLAFCVNEGKQTECYKSLDINQIIFLGQSFFFLEKSRVGNSLFHSSLFHSSVLCSFALLLFAFSLKIAHIKEQLWAICSRRSQKTSNSLEKNYLCWNFFTVSSPLLCPRANRSWQKSNGSDSLLWANSQPWKIEL